MHYSMLNLNWLHQCNQFSAMLRTTVLHFVEVSLSDARAFRALQRPIALATGRHRSHASLASSADQLRASLKRHPVQQTCAADMVVLYETVYCTVLLVHRTGRRPKGNQSKNVSTVFRTYSMATPKFCQLTVPYCDYSTVCHV